MRMMKMRSDIESESNKVDTLSLTPALRKTKMFVMLAIIPNRRTNGQAGCNTLADQKNNLAKAVSLSRTHKAKEKRRRKVQTAGVDWRREIEAVDTPNLVKATTHHTITRLYAEQGGI
ncbi:hypothetical protein ElyMa_002452800 [Elysia marginata]|uniref:Uncharacterized protein n=1 Tax=Elysia marginata TaxID=1093978 RepID=A0AAV4GK61_9GAST|nr:hypothetical protein ElyMa_002452800 [Elysia marginata]